MAKVKLNFQDSLLQKIEIIAAQSKVPRDLFIQYLCAQQLLAIQNKGVKPDDSNIIDGDYVDVDSCQGRPSAAIASLDMECQV